MNKGLYEQGDSVQVDLSVLQANAKAACAEEEVQWVRDFAEGEADILRTFTNSVVRFLPDDEVVSLVKEALSQSDAPRVVV